MIGGISILPKSEHLKQLTPYEEIYRKRYEELASEFPKLDITKLVIYENNDQTEGAREYACVGSMCEVDIVESDLKLKTTD